MDHSLFIPFAILFYLLAAFIIKKFWWNWIEDRIEKISLFWMGVIWIVVLPLSYFLLKQTFRFTMKLLLD